MTVCRFGVDAISVRQTGVAVCSLVLWLALTVELSAQAYSEYPLPQYTASPYTVPGRTSADTGLDPQVPVGGYAASAGYSAWDAGPQAPPAGPMMAEPTWFDTSDGVETSWIGLDTPTTWSMLDFQNRQSEKELTVLESQQSQCTYPRLIVGAQFRASALLGKTNTADAFPYMGRFPPDFHGKSVSDLRLLQSNQDVIAHVSPWVSGYAETLFSDVFTFPTFQQGSWQVRQAYAVIGNLNESPFYAFIGKKNVNFGDMRTLSPFTQSIVWHYFGALAEGGGVGYSQNGLNLSFTALNGSRGIRVVDSPRGGRINNFAANGSYEFSFPWGDLMLGGGYIDGTIYNGSVAEHTSPQITGPQNGAWDVNGRLRWDRWYFSGEYVTTERRWPVTNHRVNALRAEVACDYPLGTVPAWWAMSWSAGVQGPLGAEFDKNEQFVIGVELQPSPNVLFTVEYVRSMGFAPLINITTASDRSVRQNSLVFGLVLAI
ncbi:MAG: hypothetical protein KDA58_01690 [Planctomycetaceae bacterium]|nr:hypothetical protein [Planctomycetaceae bacterium]